MAKIGFDVSDRKLVEGGMEAVVAEIAALLPDFDCDQIDRFYVEFDAERVATVTVYGKRFVDLFDLAVKSDVELEDLKAKGLQSLKIDAKVVEVAVEDEPKP